MTKIPVQEQANDEPNKAFSQEELERLAAAVLSKTIKAQKALRWRAHISTVAMVAVSMFLAACAWFIVDGSWMLHKALQSNPASSQCESIGGRYDGETCWYGGNAINVDKYINQ